MIPETHAITMNGRISGLVKGVSGPEFEIRRTVHLLDGNHRFSLGLWALPVDLPFDCVDFTAWPVQYIQAAGGAGRMMVEIRAVIDGVTRHYVIGRPDVRLSVSAASPAEPTVADEVIVWGGVETVVQPHEVFCADEVSDLFVAYFLWGDILSSYRRRLILT